MFICTKRRDRVVGNFMFVIPGGHGFPQCLEPNAGVVPWFKLQPLASKYFTFHHWRIMRPFDAS